MSTITITSRGDGSFESIVDGHHLVVDRPPDKGGKGRGPVASDLFVVSLGSCVAAYVTDYCRAAGLDATGMSVDVVFERAQEPARLTGLDVVINLPHADVGDHRDALLRVADHCPVMETVEYTLEPMALEVRDRVDLEVGAQT